MRVGFLGPQGTFSHQALLGAGLGENDEAVALPSIYETVMAVSDGLVERSLVPIENALEGSVDVTLDALAGDAADVEIVGELVQRISNCLITPTPIELARIEVLYSHPQPIAQCAGFLRRRLGNARIVATASTAAAVRDVLAAPDAPHAALGNRLAAELYGGTILLEGVDDAVGNETRFVWLARRSAGGVSSGAGPRKTSLVFWGAGDEQPGWLVACLGEFSQREISLTRIESRPRRVGLGHYMFFADLVGALASEPVAAAIEGLRGHCQAVRILGSYAPATLAPKD